MHNLFSIILTLIAGLFFLIGGFIAHNFKNKDDLNHFSISLAFIIMLSLLIFDLLPEIIELTEDSSLSTYIMLIIFAISGFVILKVLDKFIPDHHHEHKENHDNKKEHIGHLHHLGLITFLSLILHNILEGFAIFGISNTSLKIGLLTSISVALHNIPLGTHIFSSLDIKEHKLMTSLLTLSSLFGGLIFLVIGNVSNLVLASITSITLGMILYITLIELLPEVINNIKNKNTIIGLSIGFILLICSLFI